MVRGGSEGKEEGREGREGREGEIEEGNGGEDPLKTSEKWM